MWMRSQTKESQRHVIKIEVIFPTCVTIMRSLSTDWDSEWTDEKKLRHTIHRSRLHLQKTQSNTHVLFTWLLVVFLSSLGVCVCVLTNEKLLFEILLHWSIKNQFILVQIAGCRCSFMYALALIQWPSVLAFFSVRIPICMLIRCQPNNNNSNSRKKRQRSGAYCCLCWCWAMRRFVQCGDRPNYYFSCYMCYITRTWKIHMHTKQSDNGSDARSLGTNVASNAKIHIYARARPTHILRRLRAHLTSNVDERRKERREMASEWGVKKAYTPQIPAPNQTKRNEIYTLFGLKAKFLITYS